MLPEAGEGQHLVVMPRDGEGLLTIGLLETVSALALIGCRVPFGSLTQPGSRPQRSRSRRRSPVSGCRRTTGAVCVGATFQDGGWFGGGPEVPKKARTASMLRNWA